MRLTSLTVEHFRCFRGSTRIDLAADVVAIYGRNGSGKTTVFDAIEWALLGEIGRFASEPETAAYLPNALEQQLPVVCVGYDDDGDGYLEARLQQDGTVALSPSWSNHRDLLYDWLVQDAYQPARREVSAVRDLFRASVLLSQWSIRNFVERASPEERASVLAHIAGVPYLQRCLEKAQEVQRLAGRRAADVEGQSRAQAEEIQKMSAELAATENRRKATLARLGEKLVEKNDLAKAMVAAQLPLDTSSATQGAEELSAGAIAMCREALADLDRRDRALAELEAAAKGHRERVQQREQLARQEAGLRTNAAQLEKRESELSAAVASTQAKARTAKRTLEDLTKRLLAIDELSRMQTQLEDQRRQVEAAKRGQSDLQNAIREGRARVENLSAMLVETESDRRNLIHSRDRDASSLDSVRKLFQSIPAYRADVGNLGKCDARLAALERELQALQERGAQLQQARDTSSARLTAAERKHGQLTSAQQRKASLVASLQEYATGDQCPMCGVKHETPQALAHAIETQLRTAPRELRDLARRIELERAEVQRAQSELRLAKESIERGDEERRATSTERAKLAARIAAQDRLAKQVGTEMEAQSIERIMRTLDARIGDVAKKLQDVDAVIRQLSKEKDEIQMATARHEAALAEGGRRLVTVQAAIARLESQAADLSLPDAINLSFPAMAEMRARAEGEREAVRAQRSTDENELARITREWDSARESREKIHRDLDQCVKNLARLTEAIRRTERLSQELAVEAHDPEEATKTLREDLADRRRTVNLAATTAEQYQWSSAVRALTEHEHVLRMRHAELKTDLARLTNERVHLQEAGRVAERWSDKLRSEVTTVVERRIKTHQPEILRLFRAMVPCPYLFEDIEMRRSEAGVHLALRYRDQKTDPGEPKLFLSEAQANVLALAVFLSFACSQRWSRLQTILLDDPVQHLDDLDAVAFLDNLRAVALRRKKQVIVSTCDQNLYLLMIRKFRVIDKEGISFRGISLLENGGNAPDVVYDVGGPGRAAAA